MPTPALRGGASAPLSPESLAALLIEQIELSALDAKADTRAFAAQVSEMVASYFAPEAVAA